MCDAVLVESMDTCVAVVVESMKGNEVVFCVDGPSVGQFHCRLGEKQLGQSGRATTFFEGSSGDFVLFLLRSLVHNFCAATLLLLVALFSFLSNSASQRTLPCSPNSKCTAASLRVSASHRRGACDSKPVLRVLVR